MDQLLFDVDEQPPYVELYNHHPLMYMSLCNHRQACSETTPKELLYWCHGVQCKIDNIASSLGLYKIKVLGNTGPSCMFTISPDMPPKQQAAVMFNAAMKLRAMLSEVLLPGGDTLFSQITIHAGQYAGGVVGKSSWTYDVFGSDVQDLLDMDRVNSPNAIQVSDPALALMSEPQQFAPACKVVCSGRELVLHRWLDQAAAGQAAEDGSLAAAQAAAAAAAAVKAQAVHDLQQLPLMPPSPVKRHAAQQQQHRQPFAASKAVGDAAGCTPFGSRSSAGPDSICMQPDLLFTDASLEDAYLQSQTQQLARMDMIFVAVTMLMMAGVVWSGTYSPLLLLVCCGQWLVPVVAACWYMAAPRSYCKHREPLWVLHRVLSAMKLAGVLLYSVLLQQQQQQQQQSLLHGAAAVGMATQSVLGIQNCVADMLRRSAVVMLADALGFKIRFRAHLVTVALSASVTAMGVAWQWSSGSGSGQQRNLLALWDLLVRLSVGCLGPTLLLYRWELEDRSMFLATRQQGVAGYAAGMNVEQGWLGARMPAKAKVV